MIEMLEDRRMLSASAAHAAIGRLLHTVVGRNLNTTIGALSTAPPQNATIDVNWGDGSGDAPATLFQSGRRVDVISSHTYSNPGRYSVVVTQQTPSDTSPNQTFTPLFSSTAVVRKIGRLSAHTIRALPVQVGTPVAGEPLREVPAQLVGVPASVRSATAKINWGDGSVDTITVTPDSFGNVIVPGGHTYGRTGAYTAVVTFLEGNKILGRASRRIVVTRNSPGVRDLSATTGTPFHGVLGTLTMTVTPHQVGVEWGDGTLSMGTYTVVGKDQYQITGAHTYAEPGTYRVKVIGYAGPRHLFPIPGETQIEAADFVGDEAEFEGTMTVSGPAVIVPPTPVQVTALPVADAAADTLNLVPLARLTGLPQDPLVPQVYSVIDWGDGSAGSSPLGAFTEFDNGAYVVKGNHQYMAFEGGRSTSLSGTFTVTVTFLLNDHDDPTKNTVLGTAKTTVTALPNSAGGTTLALTHGQAFSGSVGTFMLDPGVTFIAASLDWGDSSSADFNPTITPLGNNTYRVTSAHTYASPGRYRISLQLNEPNPGGGSTGVSDVLVSTAAVT